MHNSPLTLWGRRRGFLMYLFEAVTTLETRASSSDSKFTVSNAIHILGTDSSCAISTDGIVRQCIREFLVLGANGYRC
ncbi:hypothetical protein EDD17DRAFT_1075947 [Pisolithus thermaeus]|nr:hypothetical protein EDD17DRAFT_1075947 [Pisolithus thermaeus]